MYDKQSKKSWSWFRYFKNCFPAQGNQWKDFTEVINFDIVLLVIWRVVHDNDFVNFIDKCKYMQVNISFLGFSSSWGGRGYKWGTAKRKNPDNLIKNCQYI